MSKQFEIKGTLVKDKKNHYSYNLTSKIDAEKLYTTLTTYEEKLQLYENITQRIDKATQSLIEIQMSLTILQNDVNKLKEALK